MVLKAYPDAVFLIVGEGRLLEKLQNQTIDLKISTNVIFIGTQNNIPEILNALDVFVLPSSKREGLGISILEAMATERPVIATSIGGIPEVVSDGETGILVPPEKVEDLAEAIIELLNYPDKAHTMGQMGGQKVREKFTTHRMLEEIEELYEFSLQKKK